jgi:signal transduction histidine kinase
LIDESLDVLNGKLNGNIAIDKRYKRDLPKILDFGLAHVVINIVKNALDAMPDGGRLEISTDIKDSTVEINFKDTGLGVPQEIKERIFEPFFTTKSMDKGTGLGLAICNEIIHRYTGKIEVQSSSQEGTTFTVLIPNKYLENA